jgi:alpha-glucoside transport system substrate-binding protein
VRISLRKRWRHVAAAGAVVAFAVTAAGISASQATSGVAGVQKMQASQAVSGTISFDGVWTGNEAKNFGAVIQAFNKVYPQVKVNYKPVGDNLPTVLSTAVAGGNPPDMADIAQPGLVKQFVQKGALKPITYARSTLLKNFSPAWIALATFNKKIYGLVFKASNKATIWYNVHAFTAAGVKAPKTWPQLAAVASTISASGVPPYSIGGADGWTLTDLFENIYLRQAGPARYALLTTHKMKWTNKSVTAALKSMAVVIGKSGNMAGGTSGAVQTDFPTSVNNVFQNPPKAAMVLEGDFVPGVATVKATARTTTSSPSRRSTGRRTPS